MTEPAAAQDSRRIDMPTQRCGPDHFRAPEVDCDTLEDLDDVWQFRSPYFYINQQLRQAEERPSEIDGRRHVCGKLKMLRFIIRSQWPLQDKQRAADCD